MKTPDFKSRILLVFRTFLLRGLQYFKFTQFFPAFVFNLGLFLLVLLFILVGIFITLISFFDLIYQLNPGFFGLSDLFKNLINYVSHLETPAFLENLSIDWSSFLFRAYVVVTFIFYTGVELYKYFTGKDIDLWSFGEKSKYTLYFLTVGCILVLLLFSILFAALTLDNFTNIIKVFSPIVFVAYIVGLILNFYSLGISYVINGLIRIIDDSIEKFDQKFLGGNVDFSELS